MTRIVGACICLLVPVLVPHAVGQDTWKAATDSVVITPDEPMWMAGYASRNKPSEGKVQDLFAKALAIEQTLW